jgi:hypothetical protein
VTKANMFQHNPPTPTAIFMPICPAYGFTRLSTGDDEVDPPYSADFMVAYTDVPPKTDNGEEKDEN